MVIYLLLSKLSVYLSLSLPLSHIVRISESRHDNYCEVAIYKTNGNEEYTYLFQ